jgi:tetratricopeptide (TPR) repeat protein
MYISILKKKNMDSDLAQLAVFQALSGNWKEAVNTNKKILKIHPDDIEALNRLARAHAELGNLIMAKTCAQKVLKFDPFNSIASKSLLKWKDLRKVEPGSSSSSFANLFLEEPGRTRILSLIHLGDAKVIAKLDSGDAVELNAGNHRISVTISDGKYIGRLADDISSKLRKLINLGYEYKACVKSADSKEVKIFIREVKRPGKFSDVPSFTSERIDYVSFTPPELVHRKEDIRESVQEEEAD